MSLNYIEVDYNKKETIKKFKEFYYNTIVPNFDINQTETYEQLLQAIKEKDTTNPYHVILILDDESNILGGIIFDYFIKTNVGFIEYIVTNEMARKKGVATYAFNLAIKYINNDAKNNGFNRADFICGEVEKQIHGKQAKHYFWERYGFRKIDFNYIQPPLDKTKEAVEIMNLGIFTTAPEVEYEKDYIDAKTLKSILYDYCEDIDEGILLKKMYKEIDEKANIKKDKTNTSIEICNMI